MEESLSFYMFIYMIFVIARIVVSVVVLL